MMTLQLLEIQATRVLNLLVMIILYKVQPYLQKLFRPMLLELLVLILELTKIKKV